MSYLGLDLATNTGWALWSKGQERPHFGSFNLSWYQADEIAPSLEKLRRNLSDVHKAEAVEALFYEAPIMRGVDNLRTLRLLLGLANMVEWWAYKLSIPCRQVEMRDWRKHFLGMSTGGRDALKAASLETCRRLGWSVANHDQSDAGGVLEFGLACFNVDRPWRDDLLLRRAA